MSNSINVIIVCGNVTKDAEVRTLSDGETKVASFTVATSDGGYTTKDGREIKEVTQFHRVTAFRGLASLAEKAIKKGVLVTVQGKMTYRTWFDDEQNKTGRHDSAEILADEIKISGRGESTGTTETTHIAPQAPAPKATDDLPF